MLKLTTIKLARVQYEAAVHLCACGCGLKVSTPLGPTEWSFRDSLEGPSLEPSIGNWEFPCRSHYWIQDGQVTWSVDWTREQVQDGRRVEEERRHAYYDSLKPSREGFLRRLWRWIKSFFR